MRSVAEAVAAEIRRQSDGGAERLDWARLEKVAGCGRRQIDRLFAARFGGTPARFLRDLRTDAAEALLAQGHDVVSAAAQAGFSGGGRLHDAVVARRGVTPGELRARGAGVRVAIGFFATPLGTALLAATDRGLCALRLCTAAAPEACLAEVEGELCEAEFVEDAAALQHYADQLVAFLERRAKSFLPPVDVAGTEFQRAVWEELRRVPAGSVLTYAELARRIGRPRSVRAVASACAGNPVAIAIPCHRIVRSDGGLGGYAWGLKTKASLLEIEGQGTA